MKTFKSFITESIPSKFQKYKDRIDDWNDERGSGNSIFVALKDG